MIPSLFIKPFKIKPGFTNAVHASKKMCFKKSLKLRKRRSLPNVQGQIVPQLWSCYSQSKLMLTKGVGRCIWLLHLREVGAGYKRFKNK